MNSKTEKAIQNAISNLSEATYLDDPDEIEYYIDSAIDDLNEATANADIDTFYWALSRNREYTITPTK